MSTNRTEANRLSDSSNRERNDFSADAALISLKSRNRDAAWRLEAAFRALADRDDEIGAEILIAAAAELVDDDPHASPFRCATSFQEPDDRDDSDLPFGVVD